MAIRDIVTIGFGNGTFSPGLGKIPTLGYSSVVVVAVISGVTSILDQIWMSALGADEVWISALRPDVIWVSTLAPDEVHFNS